MSGKPDIHESKENFEGFEHIELPAKLLDHFLRKNKSNIKQTQKCYLRRATNVTFSKFRGSRRQKKAKQFFETRAVLIDWFGLLG